MAEEPEAPAVSPYRLAWGLYLALAIGGTIWLGVREGAITWRLFFPARPLDLAVDLAAGAATAAVFVALWEAARRTLPPARELEERIAGALGPIGESETAALALLSGFAEELFFRGAAQRALGLWPAAALFTLVHTGPGRAFRLWTLYAALAGLALGGLVAWRGHLAPAIAAHALINGFNLRRFSRRAAV